ncbi:MAG: ParB/RepB/Spo0J family partition protein [Syntrophomonadaceae bacterium]
MVKGVRGLGRGLEALLSNDEETLYTINDIEMDLIQARPDQPRQSFDEESLRELSESIKQHGVLQPILLRPIGGIYQIVAGERRWRAARLAELKSIPAVVKEMPDAQAAEISLVENLQRKDLNAVEEARALQKLSEEFNYTQEQLSSRLGKSRSHIANTIRLLSLPQKVLDMVEKGMISAGHARALVGLSETEQYRMAEQIAGKGISVRDIEEKVRKSKKSLKSDKTTIEVLEIEERIQKHLSTKARIKTKKKGGILEIPYFDEEDLERILEIIGIPID